MGGRANGDGLVLGPHSLRPAASVIKSSAGATRLSVRTVLGNDPVLEGLVVELDYELYEGYPAVRKWVAVRNGGSQWLKLERLVVDDLQLTSLMRKPLAAALFGVQPSVVHSIVQEPCSV